jgi:phage gp29-like protein
MTKILDQNGNPIDLKSLKREVAAPQASGIRTIASRASSVNLDPLRLARILKSAEAGDTGAYLELAEEMEEKYLHYSAQLSTRKRAVSGIQGEIIPASEEAKDMEIAEFVRESLPVIQAAIYDMLDAIGKGFSATEIVWDDTGRQWRPARLEFRDPRWFLFNKVDGRTLKLRSDLNADGEPLFPGQFIIHTSSNKTGLPIRGGLARAVCWAYLFQNFALKDWVQFIETFGKPLRLGRYEGEVTKPSDIDILVTAVQSLGTDAAAVLPRSMEIEFPEVAQARGENGLWHSLLEYLDRQVSKLVLGQTLTADTGEGGGGSYALGGVHNDIRIDILFDDARALANTINRDLIRILVNLNFAGVENYPQFALRVEEPEDQVALVGIVEKAVAMGQPVSQKWFSEKFGIPLPEEGEAVLGQQVAMPEGEGGGDAQSAANGAVKFDASLINAYSMGIDRFVRLGMAVPEQFVRDVFSIPVPAKGDKLLEATADPAPEGEVAAHKAGDHIADGGKMVTAETQAVDRLARETQPIIDKWIAQIGAMLDKAESLEEFQAMIAAAYSDLNADELQKRVALAFTAMNLSGRAEVEDGQ